MRKTIREWLQDLPDPARSQALANVYQEYAGEWSESLPKALKRAFLWFRSPEGYEYWQMVYNSIL